MCWGGVGRRAEVRSSSGGIAVCVLMGTEVPWSAVMQTVGKLSLLCLGVWVGAEAGSYARAVYIYIRTTER